MKLNLQCWVLEIQFLNGSLYQYFNISKNLFLE
ncbi:KTSC domain-containing protein [Acinetobacter sp. Marseille-Q1618]